MTTKKYVTALALGAILALTGAASASAAKPAEKKLTPLKVALPKQLFVGTPKNLRVRNLDDSHKKPRGTFYVPPGTVNVALNKPVTSSDELPLSGDMEQITDGEKEGEDGYYVEMTFGRQHVQIDLKETCPIYAILLWHYHQEARVYHDIVVQVADDPDFITNVRTVFNNDDDNSAGLGVGKDKAYVETFRGKLIDTKGVKARYVRLYSKGNTSDEQNHYVEVEVYGMPANAAAAKPGAGKAARGKAAPTSRPTSRPAGSKKGLVPLKLKLPKQLFVGTPKNLRVDNLDDAHKKKRGQFHVPPGIKNISHGKPVSSSDELPIVGDLEQITDAEKEGEDGYYVELGFGRQYVQIDLRQIHAIHAILLWHYHQEARVYHDVVLQVADDPDFITKVRTIFNNDIDNSAGLGVGTDKAYVETYQGKLVDAKGIKARYLRLYSKGNTSNEQNHYVEVEVFGKPAK